MHRCAGMDACPSDPGGRTPAVDAPLTLRPGDGRYPASLARAAPPPAELRLRGSLGAPRRRVAVVGARATDATGRDTARRLGRGLARGGVSVVSGGALGVDAAAHEGALEVGGHTVAVLGCGVDVSYPPSHRDLFARILEGGGALLSELADGAAAAPWTFPRRNRLVSALADAVVVVRAGARSGALITAALARAQGVPLLAVPGDVDNPLAAGPNRLLREGAGAVTGAEDVLAFLGLSPGAQAELPLAGLPPPERALLGALGATPAHADQLARAAGLAPGAALAALLSLELAGLAEQRPGLRFRRGDG
ncbi:MAG: DNA-protecting protein DprA [Anaeromyxobacter sp.]|nr:DNA-protecting protein DprA [Anaeromyxobacter sp.]MBL0274950.1 DNA-protecting protein DprA [Anaeromyxobacter sp.]